MKTTYLTIAVALLFGAGACAAEYKVDGNFVKGHFIQLAIDSNDVLCALDSSGNIVRFKSDGTVASSFPAKMAEA
ncbi:MAG TPA: hypothetical protein VLL07_05080, partial [Pontiella sp.]|nr:hypothetical protein [Pontiella sp.]